MTILPDSNTEYKNKTYWDARYQQEETFDWFKKYDDLKAILSKHIPDKSASIIMLGCGNSTLSEDMYNDGYRNILNVDFSETVIERMRLKHADKPEMKWEVMDVQNLEKIKTSSFDVAIDKGTMDALMCEKGDVWEPSLQLIEDVKKEVDEVNRILNKSCGRFIYITFGQPHFRKRHLERPNWDFAVDKIGDAFHYYVYVMSFNKHIN